MRRLVLLTALLALVGATVAAVDAGAAGPRARAMKLRLKPFTSCQRLVKYARHNVKRELRYPRGGVAAPRPPPPVESGPRGGDDGAGAGGEGPRAAGERFGPAPPHPATRGGAPDETPAG